MTSILKHICAAGFYNAAVLNKMPVCNEYDGGKNSVIFFIYLGIFIDNFGFWQVCVTSSARITCISVMHISIANHYKYTAGSDIQLSILNGW